MRSNLGWISPSNIAFLSEGVSVPGLTTAPQMKDLPRAGRPTSTSTTASHDTTCQDESRFRRGGGSDAVHLSLQKNSRFCWLRALHSLRRSRNQKEFLWEKMDMPKNSISRESVKKNDWNENLCSKTVWEIWFGNKNREGGPTIQWGFLHAPQTNYQFTLHSTDIATKIILS